MVDTVPLSALVHEERKKRFFLAYDMLVSGVEKKKWQIRRVLNVAA